MFQVPFAVMKSSSPLEVAKKRRPPPHFQTAGRGDPGYLLSIVPKDFLGASQNALLGRPMKTVFRKSVDALTEFADEINSREVYTKGIEHSYYYEGYAIFKVEEL